MQRFGKRRHRIPDDPSWTKFFADEDRDDRQRKEELLDTPLTDSGLIVRTVNTLEAVDMLFIRDLAVKTRDQLLTCANVGEETLSECNRVLNKLGVEHPDWNRPGVPRQRKKRKIRRTGTRVLKSTKAKQKPTRRKSSKSKT